LSPARKVRQDVSGPPRDGEEEDSAVWNIPRIVRKKAYFDSAALPSLLHCGMEFRHCWVWNLRAGLRSDSTVRKDIPVSPAAISLLSCRQWMPFKPLLLKRSTRMNSVLASIVLLLIAASPVVLRAQRLPSTMSYQALVEGATGQPIADGTHHVTFALFSGANAQVWSESQDAAVRGGVLSVTLGSTTPLPQPFPSGAELEITIDNIPLSPRTKLAGAPWAMDLGRSFVAAVAANGFNLPVGTILYWRPTARRMW
jgi:hypothetical protein